MSQYKGKFWYTLQLNINGTPIDFANYQRSVCRSLSFVLGDAFETSYLCT